MARGENRARRGFAAMDPEERREIARRGGLAPHDEPRGFAAMDPEERRKIARRGGQASHGGRGRNWQSEDSGSQLGINRRDG